MWENPQIPDKNKIYPGQTLKIPDTIGPPMLPPKPKPKLNAPELPFQPWIIPPSLDPVPEDGIIQEVYLRYREGWAALDGGKIDWDGWES